MGARKGRQMREQDGAKVLFANVGPDVIDILDVGAAALGWSRAKYVEEFIRRAPRDQFGVPVWVHELAAAEQLPLYLEHVTDREESQQTAA